MIIHQSPALQNSKVSEHDLAHSQDQSPVLDLLNELNAVAIKLRQKGKLENGAGISGAEHAVLEIVQRQSAVTVPRIARERFTSRQNIQILVDRLESEGHLEIVGNPAHKRSALVRLTEQGRTWLREDEQGRKQLHNEIGALFSLEELSAFRMALRKLHAALGAGNSETQNGHQPAGSSLRPEQYKPVPARSTKQAETAEEQFPVNLL